MTTLAVPSASVNKLANSGWPSPLLSSSTARSRYSRAASTGNCIRSTLPSSAAGRSSMPPRSVSFRTPRTAISGPPMPRSIPVTAVMSQSLPKKRKRAALAAGRGILQLHHRRTVRLAKQGGELRIAFARNIPDGCQVNQRQVGLDEIHRAKCLLRCAVPDEHLRPLVRYVRTTASSGDPLPLRSATATRLT